MSSEAEPLPARRLFAGRVLFHFHTALTDGAGTAADYAAVAARHGLDRVVFLEHVRRSPRYDTRAFADEVAEAGAAHAVEAVLGFEAKVLPGGAVDLDDADLARAAALGVAEHAFPADVPLWEASLRAVFRRYGALAAEKAVVWVHPGLFLKKHGLWEREAGRLSALVAEAQDAGLWVERNGRYGLLPPDRLGAVRPGRLVHGADAHAPAQAEAWVASGWAAQPVG